jgi:flagellar biosynthesis/type III secretory pathway M-ring protein FliF/YscJ
VTAEAKARALAVERGSSAPAPEPEGEAARLIEALGPEDAAAVVEELIGGPAAPAAPGATDPFAAADPAQRREIKARVARLAAERPELLAKIIEAWLRDSRTRR